MQKTIIIGATSGIGRVLAQILADTNYKVGITGRRKDKLKTLRDTNPEKFVVSAYDCTKESNADKLTAPTNELGGLDLLILSSGRGDLNETLDFEIENSTNQLNVIAFTEIASWAFNYFKKQAKGHLVVISSIAGIRGSHLAPAYNASKAYQINYLEGLRQKATKSGLTITITDIRPGFVDTDMAKGEDQFWVATKEKAAKQIYQFIRRKKDIGYVTKRWRLIALVLKILPNWIYKRM